MLNKPHLAGLTRTKVLSLRAPLQVDSRYTVKLSALDALLHVPKPERAETPQEQPELPPSPPSRKCRWRRPGGRRKLEGLRL